MGCAAVTETDVKPTIHRYAAGPAGALVNAYLVEGDDGVVAIDGTLTVSDGRALRARLDGLGKPLLAVLVTHAHPDHYGGLTELVASDEVPIVAVSGVSDAIRRDDGVKGAGPATDVRRRVGRRAHLPQPDRLGR